MVFGRARITLRWSQAFLPLALDALLAFPWQNILHKTIEGMLINILTQVTSHIDGLCAYPPHCITCLHIQSNLRLLLRHALLEVLVLKRIADACVGDCSVGNPLASCFLLLANHCLETCASQASDEMWVLSRSKKIGCLGHLMNVANTVLRVYAEYPGTLWRLCSLW